MTPASRPSAVPPTLNYAGVIRRGLAAQLKAACAVRDAYRRAGDETRTARHLDRINRLLDRYNEAKSDSTFAEIARGEQP